MGLEAAEIISPLRDYIASVAGCEVEVGRLERLSGGAIQENWALDVAVAAGAWAGDHRLVLRRDAKSAVRTSHGRVDEFRLLKAAYEAGVRVPEPCFACDDPDVLGGPFFLMHRIDGVAAGHKLVRQPENPELVRELGRQLARIHAIDPARAGLDFLGAPPEYPAKAAVERYMAHIDALSVARPVLEWAMIWLADNSYPPGEAVLCHRDFRTGNYLVDDGRLAAILDWEFAGWGDALEDIAWFCAKCWRFRADRREAGGIAGREPFYEGYEAESGRAIDRRAVAYWEVMAHLRWAVIAAQQAERHVSGEEPSLELALTAHVIPELELEILEMTRESDLA